MKRFSQYMLLVALTAFSPSCGEKAEKKQESNSAQSEPKGSKVSKPSIEDLAHAEQRNRIAADTFLRSSGNKQSPYSRAYHKLDQGEEAGTFSFNGEVKVIPSQVFTDIPSSQLSPREKPLQILPIWQREIVSKLRSDRQEIYDEGAKEGESMRSASPEKRREWIEQWNDKVRNPLTNLKRRESAALRKTAPEPSEDEISSLLARLTAQNPELGESDLPVIEFLLPPPNELETYNNKNLDDQTLRLLEAHKILADQFPQSLRLQKQF